MNNKIKIITGIALAKHLNGLGDTLKLYLALPPAETRGSTTILVSLDKSKMVLSQYRLQ